MKMLIDIITNESGQGLAEYSLIISLVTLIAVVGVYILGESAYNLYETIKEDVIGTL